MGHQARHRPFALAWSRRPPENLVDSAPEDHEPHQSLWSEWTLLTVARGVASLLAAGVFVVASRNAPRVDFGILVTTSATAAFAACVIDFGLGPSVLRAGGVNPADGRWFRRAVATRLLGAVASATVAAVLAATSGAPSDHVFTAPGAYISLGLSIGCGMALEVAVLNLLIAARRSTLSVVVLVMDRALSALILLGFGIYGAWIPGLAASLVLGPLGCLVGVVLLGPRAYSAQAALRSGMRERTSFVQTSASVQVQNLEVPIVSAVSGAVQGAYIGLGSRLTGPLTIAANVGSSLVLRPSSDRTSSTSRRQLVLIGALPAVVLLVLAAAPSSVLSFVLGSGYHHAVGVLRIVLVTTAVNCFVQPQVAYLQRQGHLSFVSSTVMACVALGLASCALGARLDGATGGAFGMLICQVVQTAVFTSKSVSTSRRAGVPQCT